MLSFKEFLLLEKFKYYVLFGWTFRLKDFVNYLEENNKYEEFGTTKEEITETLKQFDDMQHCTWITKKRNINREELEFLDITPGYTHKNVRKLPKRFFYDTTKTKSGKLIKEIEPFEGVYLYIFDKKKARQDHGFKFEEEILSLNNFSKFLKDENGDLIKVSRYNDKFDAYGDIKEDFIESRIENYDLYLNENRINSFEEVPKEFKKENFWSIKVSKSDSNIDMASSTNILNINDDFIFCIRFYKDINTIINEYYVYIEIEKFKDLLDFENLKRLNDHLIRLMQKYKYDDKKWKDFLNLKQMMDKDNILKFSPKRHTDRTKTRMQCSITYKDFKKILKEFDYIKMVPRNQESY